MVFCNKPYSETPHLSDPVVSPEFEILEKMQLSTFCTVTKPLDTNVPEERGITKSSNCVLDTLITDGETGPPLDDSVPSKTMDGVHLDKGNNWSPEIETLLDRVTIKGCGTAPLSITAAFASDMFESLAIKKENELRLLKHKSLKTAELLKR